MTKLRFLIYLIMSTTSLNSFEELQKALQDDIKVKVAGEDVDDHANTDILLIYNFQGLMVRT